GSAGFSVRGGSPDQNFILLDEATVYNPSHALGFFSVFNNDAISRATVYKGDIPVQYGGRLSSVIDVEQKEGNMQRWGFGGGIGILSSRLFVEGPLWKGRTSIAFSGRRTYFDVFLPLAPQPEVRDVNLYFYDLNLKIAHTFNKNNRLFISGYMGQDVFGMDKDFYMRMNYGNKALSVKWNHLFSKKLSLNTTFVISDYRYTMGEQDNQMKINWTSKLTDYGGRFDFTYLLNANHTLKFGATSYYHIYNPGDMLLDLFDMTFLDTSKTMHTTLDPYHALENGIYIGNDQRIGEKCSLKYGFRISSFSNIGPDSVWYYDPNYQLIDAKYFGSSKFYNTYFGFEPRIGVNYMFTPSISLKANYSRTVQYSQLAQNSNTGNPLDLWFPANPTIKPQVANQVALGYFQSFKNHAYEISLEFYYKGLQNVIDFKDHSQVMMNEKLYGELRVGKGQAYGMEIMLQKHEGMFTGWISYTLSRAERTIADVNNGKTYLAPYDRPHAINVVLNINPHPRHSVAANWVYYTGNPATFPSGKAVIDGLYVPVYTDRNSYRMPDYHRLDVSYTFRSKPNPKKRFSWDLVFACYNV
ncbi:MAG: TonB-dependent receptor, partial [Bacteroidales bacterium]